MFIRVIFFSLLLVAFASKQVNAEDGNGQCDGVSIAYTACSIEFLSWVTVNFDTKNEELNKDELESQIRVSVKRYMPYLKHELIEVTEVWGIGQKIYFSDPPVFGKDDIYGLIKKALIKCSVATIKTNYSEIFFHTVDCNLRDFWQIEKNKKPIYVSGNIGYAGSNFNINDEIKDSIDKSIRSISEQIAKTQIAVQQRRY